MQRIMLFIVYLTQSPNQIYPTIIIIIIIIIIKAYSALIQTVLSTIQLIHSIKYGKT